MEAIGFGESKTMTVRTARGRVVTGIRPQSAPSQVATHFRFGMYCSGGEADCDLLELNASPFMSFVRYWGQQG